MQAKKQNNKEDTFYIESEQLIGKVKKLIKEGNVRRIIITDKLGKNLAEFPLTIGVVGIALAPVLAAVGAIAAIITNCRITVDRE